MGQGGSIGRGSEVILGGPVEVQLTRSEGGHDGPARCVFRGIEQLALPISLETGRATAMGKYLAGPKKHAQRQIIPSCGWAVMIVG